MEELTFYLEVEGDPDEMARRVQEAAAGLPDVSGASAVAEDRERGAVEALNEVTLTLTAAGGAVASASVLVGQVKELLEKLGVRRATVETPEGGVDQVVGSPTKENPAQK